MAQSDVLEATENAPSDLGGKYLTFGLGGEEYGLEILKVREIIGAMDITSVPRTPDFVMGVINLRGNVIPVIDLRLKFGMAHADQTEETCIIVVDVMGVEMGILVDRVSEVLDIVDEEIQPAPGFGVAVDTDFILGIGKAADKVTILLNISEVLTSGETDTLADVSREAPADTVVEGDPNDE
ncbi:MAG: chemotaxis protein CheW [Armatimonadota bacterium]